MSLSLYVTPNLTVPSAPPSGPAGGALTGTYPNPGVNLAAGAPVIGLLPIANVAASGTNGQLLQTLAGVTAWAALNLATAASVTGLLPAGNQAAQTMLGDVTGTTAASVVAKVNGATVPASGALTTGNVLQVSGGAALTYAAVNLAGGAGYVTGLLPIANIAAGSNGNVLTTTAGVTVWAAPAVSTLSGDVTGAENSNLVTTITGSAGVVNVSTSEFEWAAAASPELSQLAAVSGAGTNFLIAPQAATTAGASGSFVVNLSAPAGATTTEANFIVQRAGTTIAQIGQQPSQNTGLLWLGPGTPSGSSYSLATQSISTTVNAPSGTLYFSIANFTGNPLTMTSTNATFDVTNVIFQDTGFATALTLNLASAGATSLVWAKGTTPSLSQTAQTSTSGGSGSTGTTTSITAQAGQAATGAAHNGGAGGALNLSSGAGGASGSATAGLPGALNLQVGTTTSVTVGPNGLSYAASAVILATSGTTTLTQAQYQAPLIRPPAVTLVGAITIVLPNVAGIWLFDMSNVAAISVVNTVTFQSGSATSSAISSLVSTNQIWTVVTTGSNGIAVNT
jgi:trimeric autotransporter adhesin